MNDWEIKALGAVLRRLARVDRHERRTLQESGVDVLPVNFYSNTPSVAEIERSFEYATDTPPYLDPRIFRQERMRRILEELLEFSGEFDPPVDGSEESPRSFFWNNSTFSYSDAMAYYCFLRKTRPANIVEIGSGMSTLIALLATEKNGSGKVHCIEPYPRDFLQRDERIALHPVEAQEIAPEFLASLLGDGDVLFIDSTHTVKTGSDCLHIYLRLLPRIERDILVHSHDVFLPFGMPRDWLLDRQIFWTEQYLLLAFLIDNPKASVLYGSTYNTHWNWPLMETLMGGKCGPGGGSLWFRYRGDRSVEESPED